ncbi:hypothetical protein HEQ60_10240, partial [Haematospirillum sp. H1815]|uniref:hypothetical protein n=1 Tax=Haematospirillum sp. H1815 TaxID=2723108 RepID=UPI00143B7BD4
WSGSFEAQVTATSTETGAPSPAVSTATVAVTVTPDVDAAFKTFSGLSLEETNAVQTVGLGLDLGKPDGSERVSQVEVSGVPDGFSLVYDGNAVTKPSGSDPWTVTAPVSGSVDIAKVSLQVPAHGSTTGDVSLQVKATVVDTPEGGGTAVEKTVEAEVAVTVTPVVDGLNFELAHGTRTASHPDRSIPLRMAFSLEDRDGSEQVTQILFKNLQGWTLHDANTGESWSPSGDGSISYPVLGRSSGSMQLDGLYLVPPGTGRVFKELDVAVEWKEEGLSAQHTRSAKLKVVTPSLDVRVEALGHEMAATEDAEFRWSPAFKSLNSDYSVSRVAIYSNDPDMANSQWKTTVNGALTTLTEGRHQFDGITYKYKLDVPRTSIIREGDGNVRIQGMSVKTPKHDVENVDLDVTFGLTLSPVRGGANKQVTVHGRLDVLPRYDGIEKSYLPSSVGGNEDENGINAFAFGLSLDLKDKDGSERVEGLRFHNVPDGVALRPPGSSDVTRPHGGVIDWRVPDGLGKSDSGHVSIQGLSWVLSDHAALPDGQEIKVLSYISDARQIAKESDSRHPGSSGWVELGSFQFAVKPVPDAPDKDPVHVSGDEDTWIPLGLSWSSPDQDGSETLSVTLSGFPAGTSVLYLKDGTEHEAVMEDPASLLQLSGEEHRSLRVKAPANSDEDFELKAFIRSTEKDTREYSEVESSVRVSVRGVADGTGKTGHVYSRTGKEDLRVPLQLDQVRSRDADGSEGVSYQLDLSGVALKYPDYTLFTGGFSDLVALPGQPHHFAVGKDALGSLSLLLGPDASGVVSIPVQAVFTEREGDVRVESHTLQVMVEPVPDVPLQAPVPKAVELVLQEGGPVAPGPVAGQTLLPKPAVREKLVVNKDLAESFLPLPENAREDGNVVIPLMATPRDSDASEKVSAVSLTTYMKGFTVEARTEDGVRKTLVWDRASKSYVVDDNKNSNLVSFSELVLVPKNGRANLSGDDIPYALSFTLDDGHPDNGVARQTFALQRDLKVDPVADVPVVRVSQADKSPATLPVVGQAAGLAVLVRSGEARQVTRNNDAGKRKEGAVPGKSDKVYESDGSEAVHLVISGMKPGVVLLDTNNNVIGHDNGEGIWFLDAQVIDGLRNPADGSIPAGAIRVWAPHGLAAGEGTLKLTVEAIAVEKKGTSSDAVKRVPGPDIVVKWRTAGEAPESQMSSGHGGDGGPENNKLRPEPDAPEAMPDPEPLVKFSDSKTVLSGTEDSPLSLSGVSVVTTTGEPLPAYTSLSAVILVPKGFLLAGHIPLSKVEPYGANQDGLPIFSRGGDNPGYTSYVVPGGDLSHLSVIRDPSVKEAEHYAGSLPIYVEGVVTIAGRQPIKTRQVVEFDIKPVVDGVELSANPSAGKEGDAFIPLGLDAKKLDSSEEIRSLSLEMKDDYSKVTFVDETGNAVDVRNLSLEQLKGLGIKPAADFSGFVSFVVKAITGDGDEEKETSLSVLTSVAPVADTPTLVVPQEPLSGTEHDGNGKPALIPLKIQASLGDRDGSEVLSVIVDGLRKDGKFVGILVDENGSPLAGNMNNGQWVLNADALQNGVYLRPTPHFGGDVTLTVVAEAREKEYRPGSKEAGAVEAVQQTIQVHIQQVADKPSLDVGSGVVKTDEDTAVSLGIQSVSLVDKDGSETLSVSVSGLPTGAVLGTLAGGVFTALTGPGPDGSYAVPAGTDYTTLAVRPQENWSGTFAVKVTGTSTETGTSSSSASRDATVEVTVKPVADIPDFAPTDVTVRPAATPIAIGDVFKNVRSADTDGSEQLFLHFKLGDGMSIGYVRDGSFEKLGQETSDGWTEIGAGWGPHLHLEGSGQALYRVASQEREDASKSAYTVEKTITIGRGAGSSSTGSRRRRSLDESDEMSPAREKSDENRDAESRSLAWDHYLSPPGAQGKSDVKPDEQLAYVADASHSSSAGEGMAGDSSSLASLDSDALGGFGDSYVEDPSGMYHTPYL